MSVRSIPDFLKRDPVELGYRVAPRRNVRAALGMPARNRVPDIFQKLTEKR